jgi:hypothetical protein
MDQTTTTAAKESISPSVSIVRDVQVLLSGGVIVIAFSFFLALGGVPIKELDKWMFVLSVPWFSSLYLVSRKRSLLVSILIDSSIVVFRRLVHTFVDTFLLIM